MGNLYEAIKNNVFGTKNLIDISDCSSISYNVSNDLLTSNFLTFYNEEKVSLGYKYYIIRIICS